MLVLGFFLITGFGILGFAWFSVAVPWIPFSFVFFSSSLLTYGENFRRKEREAQKQAAEKNAIRNAFCHYLAPEVLEQAINSPNGLAIGGDKREMTILFSDVRGFTEIAQKLTSEKLVELMHRYFDRMCPILFDQKGVLDKFIGDAIMAFWGAPFPCQDGPDRAVRTAIAMHQKLIALNQELQEAGLPFLEIGVGIHTGVATVGNMGSSQHFNYTVLGDAVNLAARLEKATKDYGVKIIISSQTQSKLQDQSFRLCPLPEIQVKGRSQLTQIYQVLVPGQDDL